MRRSLKSSRSLGAKTVVSTPKSSSKRLIDLLNTFREAEGALWHLDVELGVSTIDFDPTN